MLIKGESRYNVNRKINSRINTSNIYQNSIIIDSEYDENKCYSLNDSHGYMESDNNEKNKFDPQTSKHQKQNIGNPFLLFNEIEVYLKNFIIYYKNEEEFIFFILKEIQSAIYLIIGEFINRKNKNVLKNNNKNFFVTQQIKNRGDILDSNSKVLYQIQIEQLNYKIKILKEEIDLFKNIFDFQPYTSRLNNISKNNLFKAIKEKMVENKNRIINDEFKYLFCINEQNKKINFLEKELNKKNNENLSKETKKSIKCFPNYKKYNPDEEKKNVKIPLFKELEGLKKDNKIRLKKKKIFINKTDLLDSNKKFKTNNKLLEKNKLKTNESEKQKLCLSDFDFDETKSKLEEKWNIDFNRKINFFQQKIDFDIDTKPKTLDNSCRNYKEKSLTKDTGSASRRNNGLAITNLISSRNKANDIYKKYKPLSMVTNQKEYFISHPTLEIAGIANQKEIKYIGLPRKLLKIKTNKNLEKNTLVSFPTSVCEVFSNLEKLKKHKRTKI